MKGYQENNHKCRMKQPWDTQLCQEVGQENLNRNLNSASRPAQEGPKGGLKDFGSTGGGITASWRMQIALLAVYGTGRGKPFGTGVLHVNHR